MGQVPGERPVRRARRAYEELRVDAPRGRQRAALCRRTGKRGVRIAVELDGRERQDAVGVERDERFDEVAGKHADLNRHARRHQQARAVVILRTPSAPARLAHNQTRVVLVIAKVKNSRRSSYRTPLVYPLAVDAHRLGRMRERAGKRVVRARYRHAAGSDVGRHGQAIRLELDPPNTSAGSAVALVAVLAGVVGEPDDYRRPDAAGADVERLVEGVAAEGWIRGGVPSRELTRDKDYATTHTKTQYI